jgi:gliding motility-associated-like protein
MKQFNSSFFQVSLICLLILFAKLLSAQTVNQPISLCLGDIFRGRQIAQDTQILIQNQNPVLNDTLFLIHAIQPKQTFLNQILCPNESFLGLFFQKDTMISRHFSANSTGCDSIVYYFLTVKNNVSLQISGDSMFCKGEKTTLSVGFYPKYKWSNGQTTREIEVKTSGNYTISATDSDGCTLISSFAVFVSDPKMSAETMPPLCPKIADGMIDLTVSAAISPFIFTLNGDKTNPHGLFSNLESGDFMATVADSLGCKDTIEVILNEPAPLKVIASPDITLILGEKSNFNLDITGIYTQINWSPSIGLSCSDCATPEVSPVGNTLFIVSIKNEKGCVATDSVRLTIDRKRKIFIPNAFKPAVEPFTIFAGNGVTEILSFQIFDRWGELVFSTKNKKPGDLELEWNGEFQGKKMPTAVYLFVAQIRFGDGVEEPFLGDVALIR